MNVNKLSLCNRRVLAPFTQGGYSLSQPCLNSICTSSNGQCDKEMNSGDVLKCVNCVGPIADEMMYIILDRSRTSPYPCQKDFLNIG